MSTILTSCTPHNNKFTMTSAATFQHINTSAVPSSSKNFDLVATLNANPNSTCNNSNSKKNKIMSTSTATNTTTSLLDVLRSTGPAAILGGRDPIRPLGERFVNKKSSGSLRGNSNSSKKKKQRPTTKPIRIAPCPTRQDIADHNVSEEEDPMSTSEELERFYDQATWRMYLLIQNARAAQAAAAAARPSISSYGYHGRVPHSSQSRAPTYQYQAPTQQQEKNICCTDPACPMNAGQYQYGSKPVVLQKEWTTPCHSLPAEDEKDEQIFDLEL